MVKTKNCSILHQVPSEAKIKRDLKSIVFGKILFCPHCHYSVVRKYDSRYRCKRCKRWFSLTSITWLKGAKLPLQTIWLILWCWLRKIPQEQAANTAGVTRKTIGNWYQKFRDHLPTEHLFNTRLSQDIQIDEAYRGNYSIIGAKQIKSRKVVFEYLPKKSVDRSDAVNFLSQYIVPQSNLFSDGASIYKKIENWWPVNHFWELHRKNQFKLTSEIEGIWGTYFVFVKRMYHHIPFNQVPSTLNEFNLRYSQPEIFKNPAGYLEVCLPKLKKPQPKLWINIFKKNLEIKTPEISLINKLNLVMPVPFW